jgi:hypothetical protein
MPTITSAATRGAVRTRTSSLIFGASWFDVRDQTNGTSVSVNTNDSTAIRASEVSAAGTTTWDNNRYFIAFDTTSITSTPSSATLYIYGSTSVNTDLIAVKVTSGSSFNTTTNVATTNYSNIQGYSLGVDWTGFVTDYSGVVSFPVLGWNAITLNSTALSDMNSLNTFKLALVNYSNDYLYDPPLGNYRLGLSSLSFAPYIDYGTGGYTGKVLSIASASISKVDGVLKSTISKINT